MASQVLGMASQVLGVRLALLGIKQMVACGTQVGTPFPSSHQCQPPIAIRSSIPVGYFYHRTGKKKCYFFTFSPETNTSHS